MIVKSTLSKKKPHIVIDARLYGPKHTGIGRYTKNLLVHLSKLTSFKNYNFTLLVYPELESEAKQDLGNQYNYFVTNIRHYSLQEQFLLPNIINRLQPTITHFTHFNKPLFFRGKSVVTIHDLIKHFSRGKNTTTRHPIFYWIKYFAYLFLTKITIQTNHIIVPSNYWRQFILDKYQINPQKITTTYEALDPKFLTFKDNRYQPNPKNYLIYTGTLYPHKNIDVIIHALKHLPNIQLKIISPKNAFTDKLLTQAKKYGVDHQVNFLGFLKDRQFPKIYNQALCLVHPSLMEGFSLTGLEAMALNCPVISSNRSCLPEIYGNSVIYFDPTNPNDLVQKINLLKTTHLRHQLVHKGKNQIKNYSWLQTAKQTLNVYQKVLS